VYFTALRSSLFFYFCRKDEMDNLLLVEKNILIQSICNNIVPKLVAEDIPLLRNLLQSVFPNTDLCSIQDLLLEEEIRRLCNVYHYLCVPAWLEKVLQLNQMQKLYHGIMLVGSVGTGKTAVWTTLLGAMEYLDGIKGQPYVLDPKSFTKEKLYGRLDTTTSEWTDGIFTFILRKIIKNVQGGSNKRYWIIFDGDVDPDWAENLNSVLDDNALLTLPNGERLEVPDSVRIIFEVDDLRCATLATVSRCGMVWFNSDVLPDSAITEHFLNKMR
jgi:dynein heavy chain 1, cytosolic